MTLNHDRAKKVLILEDDRALEAILDRILYSISPNTEVDWVSSVEESYSKKLMDYDLIIADIFLEGKTTGLEFWDTWQTRYPEVPILIMSSMPVDSFLKSIGHDTITPPFLSKPFSVGECRQMLQGLLEYSHR